MVDKLWEMADFQMLLDSLSEEERKLRHNIRYACFRIQNEKKGGAKAEVKHYRRAKKIEKLDGFKGWKYFAITWDISAPKPIMIVGRKWSIYQEWEQTLERVAVPLPGEIEPNVH